MSDKYFDKYGELFYKELELEQQYHRAGMEKMQAVYNTARAEGTLSETNLGQKFINHQYLDVYDGVRAFVEKELKPRRGVKPSYYSTLLELTSIYKENIDGLYHLLTFGALSILFDNIGGHKGLLKSNLGQWIAKEYMNEADLYKYIQEHKDSLKSISSGIDKRVQASYRRAYVQAIMKHDDFVKTAWLAPEMQQLAVCIINIIVDTTPYFEDDYNASTLGVKPTQALLDAWRKNEDRIISNSFRVCPTIIPPKPWEDFNTGGYYGELQEVSTLLRIHGLRSAFSKSYLKKLGQLELSQVRKAINGIQETAWRINTQVLDVVKQLIELGGGRAGIPLMDVAPKPIVLPEDPTEKQIADYKKIMVRYYKSEKRRQSIALRAVLNTKLASDFAKYERIYFPHNMDFRGRVYPIPSFSPQGDDLTKGLLLFADVPPCKTLADIEWLMVHGANLAGVDKVSYTDRIQWVRDNEQVILACAADPLQNDWWMSQDCPVQMLSFCFEWRNWKQHEATYGTPEGFITGIPIAFDGTCSGLQHYSAALRDPIGASAVNLIPADKPSDIYGIVAAKVNKKLDVACLQGTPDEPSTNKKGEPSINYGTKSLAQLWKTYGVNRKVTKRSVMTLAYGSKEYGFRDQVLQDIIEADINDGDVLFNDSNKWQASTYMAKLIWDSVNTTVVKAVEGMKWLQSCAKMVTKEGQVVTWTTPMGLPVQQSYMEQEVTKVRLRCAGKLLNLFNIRLTGNIDKAHQASGIAPNFIHSMDAAHLQLTTVNCMDAGIRHFAMIHDSYAAPASQASVLYKVVRESFIQMYTEHDIFADFKEDMKTLTTDKLPPIPSKGELDINQVRDSRYIFS